MEENSNYNPDLSEQCEDFASLSLSDISPAKKSVKKPKRILHFSDGTLEEYSSEEEETVTEPDASLDIDPKSLSWRPWVVYMASRTGKSVLSTCDYLGEGLANFFGITSPKYFYEIEEYKRAIKEEEEHKKQEREQMSGWVNEPEATNSHHLSEYPTHQFIEKNFEVNTMTHSGDESPGKKY